jgi:hypothetical protein
MTLHTEGIGGTREAEVARHYGVEILKRKSLAPLKLRGSRAIRSLDDLAGIDEFHVGGREATEALLAQLPLRVGMKSLDIGSGIGGSARYFDRQDDGAKPAAGSQAAGSLLSNGRNSSAKAKDEERDGRNAPRSDFSVRDDSAPRR